MHWTRIGSMCLSGVLVGCADMPGQSFTEVDSAGVGIAVNGTPATRELAEWRIGDEPAVSIGVVEGEPQYQLYQVMDATLLPDGAVVVVNGGSRSLLLYDADGRFLREIGRGGDGPGEFAYPTQVVHRGADTLLVWDNPQFRLSSFRTDGEFLDSHPVGREAFSELLQPPHATEYVQLLPGEGFLVSILESGGAESFPSGLFRPETGWLVVAHDLSQVDTVGFYGGVEQMFVEAGGRQFPVVPPNSRDSRAAFGGDPLRVCVGDQVGFQVECLVAERRQLVRWEDESDEVSSEEFAAWEQQMRSAWSERGLSDVADPLLARVPRGGQWPPYGDVFVDELGYLWVGKGTLFGRRLNPNPFLVFDRDGRIVARIALPLMQVFEIGEDYLVGLRRDENEVEYLEVFDLDRVGDS